MAQNVLRKLIEQGTHFTEESQARAEKLVKELVKAGELRRKDAEATVQALVDRGRKTTEQFLSLVQTEVSKQMGRINERMEGVEGRVDEIAAKLGLGSKQSASDPVVTEPVADEPPVKKPRTRKAAAKKAPAKKAAAKRAPAKRAAKAAD